jgi:hypothetical protein
MNACNGDIALTIPVASLRKTGLLEATLTKTCGQLLPRPIYAFVAVAVIDNIEFWL